jgi:putative transposase
MLLGFKTEIKVNKKLQILLAKHAGVARHAWNQGLALCLAVLDHNRSHSDDQIKFPSAIDLHKWLVASVKADNPSYYEVSKCAPQYALRHLSDAFKQFFKGTKQFPNFQKKGQIYSFTLDGSIHIEHKWIKVPVLGKLKTYEGLPFGFKPKSVTLSRQADRWFISFKRERATQETAKKRDVVGVDLGVKTLATLSSGEVFKGAKSYQKAKPLLAKLQRMVARRRKGSANWHKAVLAVAKLHRKIANIRKDTLHKLTSYLSKNHAVIGIEDFNVSGMMANHCLAASIADMGFYEFRRQLEYKCPLYGSKLIVIGRFKPSSKTCSNCGSVKEVVIRTSLPM